MVKLKMKKRGVSPVIATVLLIALVTAAAAIVFLVVIPMLQPSAEAILTYDQGSTDVGSGNRQMLITIKATGGPLTLGSVDISPVLTISVVNGTDVDMIGQTIVAESQVTVKVIGAFSIGTEYTITFNFSSGDDSISKAATIIA